MRTPWRRALPAALALALGSAVAAAQEPGDADGASGAEPGWVSDIGRRELAKAALVCVGEIGDVRAVGRTTVVTLKLIEVLRGAEPPGEGVRLLGIEPAAYVPGTRCLCFLEALSGAGRFRDLARIPLGNPEGDERLRVLREVLRAEALTDPAARRDALRRLWVDGLTGREWTRQVAIGELWVCVEREPGFLREADLATLEALKGTELKRTFRWYVESTLCRARCAVPLEAYLEATDPAVRGRAAAALAAIVDVRRDDYLARRLAGEPRGLRRAALAELYGALGWPGLVPALRARLAEDPDSRVRKSAAAALAWGDPQAAEPLLAALGADRSPEVRAVVALVLARLGERRAIAPIRALLAEQPTPTFAESYRLALKRLGAG